MILQRLYELAQRQNLLLDPAFINAPIACVATIEADGEFLGLVDLRQKVELPPRGKKGKAKVVVRGGKELPVPIRPVVWDEKQKKWKTTDPAASGKEKPAVFLADTIARVLPIDRLIDEANRAKCQAQRSTFRRFLRYAADRSNDTSLKQLSRFFDRLGDDADLRERIAKEVEQHGFGLGDLATFALNEDQGQTLLEKPAIQEWWRAFFASDFEAQEEGLFRGPCQVTQEIAAISPSVKSKISGLIPIGCRAEAYLLTGLPAADSYNLSGAVAGMVSARGIDGFTRGLNALIGNEIPGKTTSYRVGGVMFLFWTREPTDTGVINVFEPDEAQVAQLLKAPLSGKEAHALEDPNAFYLLTLSGNSARVVVRDYLETKLPRLRASLGKWFQDLRVADVTREGGGAPSSLFPLWQLTLATALDSERVAPDTPARLMVAALTGGPVPESLLVSLVRRIRAEGAAGFRPPRMGLIKLILIRMEVPVSETLNSQETAPAYVYGRLLAVFEQIQYAALGDVNANVVDKFYGTFSAAPALIFSRLYANAQNHLRKLRGDKPGAYVALDKLLSEISGLLPPVCPRGQLSLKDQGLFALGYYHQKAKKFERIAERKAEAALTRSK